MQRKILIVMMVLAAPAAEGCRRRGGEKKPPISVEKESDFMLTRKKDLLGAGLAPIPKLTDEEKKIQAALKELEDKTKASKAKENRETQIKAIGAYLLDYRQKNLSPTQYSFEKLKIALRRAGKLDWYEDVDKKMVAIPFLVIDGHPAHVLAYQKTGESEPDPAGKSTIEIGNAAVLADGQFAYLKAADLARRLKDQELLVCWKYYVQFATPLFYRTSAEFGAYVPNLQDQPPLFLAKIKAKNPDALKNPPDELNFDRLKKHLKENAPPHLLDLVAGNDLCVNLKPELAKPQDIVACRTANEGKEKDGKDAAFIYINAMGQAVLQPGEGMKLWIGQNTPKK